MAFPIIYSNKKQITSGEEVTFSKGPWTSVLSGDSVWAFPDGILDSDYVIVDGDIYSDSITLRILKNFETFTVQQIISTNNVYNSKDWTSTIIPGVGDGWNAPTLTQVNELPVSGWNFDGTSQRVMQDVGKAYILQDAVAEEIDSYQIGLKYRASDPLNIVVGGEVFSLSATEQPDFAIYPIQHSSGEIDFIGVDGGSNKWILSDGTFAYTSQVTKTLPAGTSYLIMDDFTGSSISSIGTGSVYVGNTEDIPKNVAVIEYENTNIWGNTSELNHITETIYISNSDGISGDVSWVGGVSNTLDLSGCSNVSGDVSSLIGPLTAILVGCNVDGILPSTANFMYVNLSDTNLSKTDLEDSLVNTSDRADSEDLSGGYFECYYKTGLSGMPTITSTPACNAYLNLVMRNWTVLVHAYCGGSWYG